ncbi:MAG: PEP-CTERM sorting domain-containing protein [Nibricoccus sp.]
MRFLRLSLIVLIATASVATAIASISEAFTWTGSAGDQNYNNPSNWLGGVVPPNNGSATLIFGDAAGTRVTLPLVLDVAQIQFENSPSKNYTFNTGLLTFLTVRNGLSVTSGGSTFLGENITLNIADTQYFYVASGKLDIAGGLIGGGDLVKSGGGLLRLDGFNLLHGSTQVDGGALIFSNTYALPSGSISASANGYVGAENQSTLKLMLGQLNSSTFAGSIGLDSAPGGSLSTFTDQIDVTNLTNYAGLGSTTVAKLTGNFRVSSNQDYRFSGGAGTLFVQTNLTNYGSDLRLTSVHGTPLSVFLQGSNNFGGSVNVLNSVLVLDSHQAVSSGKVLNIDGPGYIGATERFGGSTSSFLSQLKAGSPNSIAGFDSTNISAPRTITEDIDLSVGGTRNDPYYLGTTTKVTLTGKLTPTNGDSLYLTAVKGGHLIVGSTLGNNIPGVVVGQANSFDPQGGTVELTGHNNYSGGTKILGGTLRASNNSALGTGSVDVGSGATLDISSGTSISNQLDIASGGRLSGRGAIGTPGGVYFGNGAILSPGGPGSIGTLTFNSKVTFGSGSVLEFDIGNLNAGAGIGWDLVNVNSLVNLAAQGGSLITLDLKTLTLGGSAGLLTGFDATQSYSWLFLSANNISGFSSDKFVFDTSGFANSLGNGNFFVTQGNAGLSINFTPVPEPGTYALFALGLGILGLRELRRRRK